MFPEYVSNILYDLGAISLIFICPIVTYGGIKLIQVATLLNMHLELDNKRFSDVYKHLGKHDSQISDISCDLNYMKGKGSTL